MTVSYAELVRRLQDIPWWAIGLALIIVYATLIFSWEGNRRRLQAFLERESPYRPWLQWPDFEKWDQQDEFQLYEAACLWFDHQPKLPMPRRARKKYQEWINTGMGSTIPMVGESLDEIISDSMAAALNDPMRVTPHRKVDRGVLIELAENEGVKPRFLFPERRGEIDIW